MHTTLVPRVLFGPHTSQEQNNLPKRDMTKMFFFTMIVHIGCVSVRGPWYVHACARVLEPTPRHLSEVPGMYIQVHAC